jgi:hypothetical protein
LAAISLAASRHGEPSKTIFDSNTLTPLLRRGAGVNARCGTAIVRTGIGGLSLSRRRAVAPTGVGDKDKVLPAAVANLDV